MKQVVYATFAVKIPTGIALVYIFVFSAWQVVSYQKLNSPRNAAAIQCSNPNKL